MPATPQVLFICTGNFYRSRYAEALFNHAMQQRGGAWRAFSRGLRIDWAPAGDLAEQTRRALLEQAIPLHHTAPKPVSLTASDLAGAHRAIAMDIVEHRPLMQEQFPEWLDRIDYWNARDMLWERSDSAMPKIERGVAALVADLLDAPSSASA